jgi:SAM-dependent methyltransferase
MARRAGKSSRATASRESHCRLDAGDSATLRRFKRVLVEAGYLESGIAPAATMTQLAPGVTDENAPATALNTLVRLFHNGIEVPAEAAARALRPVTLESVLRAGLIGSEGESVHSRVLIQPYCGLLIAVERPLDDREDVVMLVSGSTVEVSNFTVRRHSRNSVDLGTGCGFHALMAASHSQHVFALDLNPRAVEVTRFNCVLNGIENVSCRAGNLFEPVQGERFDLIVSNPPYVISPASRLIYRDSGMDGDQFCLEVARQGVELLNPGGYFQMLFQWVQVAGEDWQERLAEELGGLGCDLWCMRLCVQEPEEYVAAHMSPYDDLTLGEEWLRYLERRNAESIGTGLLTLCRQSGRSNVLGFDEAFPDREQPYGDAVERLFINRRFLRNRADTALLAERLLPAPHLRLAERSKPEGGRWRSISRQLLCEQGLKYEYHFQAASLGPQLIALCDGKRTLQQAIEQVAAENGSRRRTVQRELVELTRGLVHYGLLMPVCTAEATGVPSPGKRRAKGGGSRRRK